METTENKLVVMDAVLMTYQELKENHISMWTWLYENTLRDKDDWFKMMLEKHNTKFINLYNECFCCPTTPQDNTGYKRYTCIGCPIIWQTYSKTQNERLQQNRLAKKGITPCTLKGSPYIEYELGISRKHNAKYIATSWEDTTP